MRSLPVILFLCAVVCATFLSKTRAQSSGSIPPYRNPSFTPSQRVADLLERMTLDEKVAMLAGAGWMETVPNARLGIPAIKMADGPMGVRSWLGSSAVTNASAPIHSTAFPAGVAMAATWDPELVRREGKAIGQEVKALGRDMILGPTVNIARVPLWGRNFEGYGEDPYLTSRLGVAYIKGVQSEGVIPSVKHFAANNQEFERHRVDASISERALQEIYFPAFKAAVQEAGVWVVMNAYNKVNGHYCAESEHLLRDILRKEWGFKGFVISDWGSTYSTVATTTPAWISRCQADRPCEHGSLKLRHRRTGTVAAGLRRIRSCLRLKLGEFRRQLSMRRGQRTAHHVRKRIVRKQHMAGGALDTPEQSRWLVTLRRSGSSCSKMMAGFCRLCLACSFDRGDRSERGGGANGGGSSLVLPFYAVTPLDGIRERPGSGVKSSTGWELPWRGRKPQSR